MNEEEKDGQGWINHRSGVQTAKAEEISGYGSTNVSKLPATRLSRFLFSLKQNLKSWTIDVCYNIWILNYNGAHNHQKIFPSSLSCNRADWLGDKYFTQQEKTGKIKMLFSLTLTHQIIFSFLILCINHLNTKFEYFVHIVIRDQFSSANIESIVLFPKKSFSAIKIWIFDMCAPRARGSDSIILMHVLFYYHVHLGRTNR